MSEIIKPNFPMYMNDQGLGEENRTYIYPLTTADQVMSVYDESTIDSVILNVTGIHPYSSSETYSVDEMCYHNGICYKCISNIETAEPWNNSHWERTSISENLTNIKTSISELNKALAELKSRAYLYAVRIPARAFENGPYTVHIDNSVDFTKCLLEFRISAWNYNVFVNAKLPNDISLTFYDMYGNTFINGSEFVVDITAYKIFD